MKKNRILKIRKQVLGENALYFCVWLGVFLVPFMNAGMMSEQIRPDMIFISWLKIMPFYLLFVTNNYLLFKYLHRRYLYWAYYLVAALLIGGVFALLEVYERSDVAFFISMGEVGQSIRTLQHTSLSVFPWWGNMLAAAAMLAANNAIVTFYRTMREEEDSERLQRQNLQAEMYYLKHQINPHFLMNTLNNIHALVDIDGEAAKQTVIQLSDMMRYVVYGGGGDVIPLKDDLKFIENYIELMRIRYTDDVKILYNKPEHLGSRVEIPPLIFIVFVENAFKHGVSYDHSSYIYIDIKCEGEYVVGRFENSVAPNKRQDNPGIGLDNVRKRLDLIYGEQYDLQTEENAERYCITLKIPTLNNYEMHRN